MTARQPPYAQLTRTPAPMTAKGTTMVERAVNGEPSGYINYSA